MGKHKRIKSIDPFFSGPRKDKLIREKKAWERKQDNPPEDPDDQPAPSSFRMMLERVEWMQKTREERRDENAELIRQAQGLHDDEVKKESVKTQMKNESNKEFLRRVAEGANAKIKDHRVKLMMDDTPDPIERPRKRKAWNKQQRSLVIMKKKRAHLKVEADIDRLEKEMFEDKIAFGDVVQHPPQLTSKPRGVKTSNGKCGGKKLLLNSLLTSSGGNPRQGAPKLKKRKAMTLHEKKVFDEKQSAAVEAYRRMKQERTLHRASGNSSKT